MITETTERGPLRWKINRIGIRGGIIRLKVNRNRMSFVKKFIFNDDETFNTAIKILRNKVTRVLHYKNEKNIYLGQVAQYAIDATEVIESQEDLF